MPTISLTTFVDYVSANGLSKVRTVGAARRESNLPYDPQRDFYKRLREAALSFSRGQLSESTFQDLPKTLSDKKKRTNFPPAIDAWIAWHSRVGGEFFLPPRGEYGSGELRVTVNPEIGIRFSKANLAIKCWFKTDAVPKARLKYVLATMRFGLPTNYSGDVGILDVRRGILHKAGKLDSDLAILLHGEATGFMAIWDALGE